MPNFTHILLAVALATWFWTLIGVPLTRRLGLSLSFAPALGWAVLNAFALPFSLALGFTPWTMAMIAGLALIISASLLRGHPSRTSSEVPALALLLAALVAVAVAVATVPKFVDGGVLLAQPMYDHAKIAIIDDMMRQGLPPGNSFFGEAGMAQPLAYYYLWHFAAASLGLITGLSGWEADIACTWFTAFASLALMMGLAVKMSGKRSAAFWVGALSVASSLRPILTIILGEEGLHHLISPWESLQSWIVQGSWVPQHLASANGVLLALVLIHHLGKNRDRVVTMGTLALVAASIVESSAWIGITFALAALPIGLALLYAVERGERRSFLGYALAAAALAGVVSSPLLHDEALATAARGLGLPIAFAPMKVLGSDVPAALRPLLDLPAYWLLFLVIEFPAIYVAGLLGLRQAWSDRALRMEVSSFALLALVSFAVAWLFVSTIANNDLGWRAILPGVLTLTVFAAAALAQGRLSPRLYGAALLFIALALPDGLAFIRTNAEGLPAESAGAFAQTPALWEAVRRHAGPAERISNNPRSLSATVRWPVNISWALFANRRSCYASWDLAHAYVALPPARIDALNTLFERVFAGEGSAEDMEELRTRYECRLIVVTPEDGAWRHDTIAKSGDYALIDEKPDEWRIYRAR
ncbi:MAG TPA: hypothetical protein VKT70_14885 [Stellaceae bacterium]|nr:hypothetical protein [Stellaceae bacterium]